MDNEPGRGPNKFTAYIWVSIAGAAGSGLVASLGGRFNGGWPLTVMVAAPGVMALLIAFLVSRTR